MAHTKQKGAANRHVRHPGKRLGIKVFGGEHVISGNILLRQKGSKFHIGLNTGMGKDFTIFATAEGFVNYKKMTQKHRGQNVVEVLPEVAPKKDK